MWSSLLPASFYDDVHVSGFKGVAGTVLKVVLQGLGYNWKGEVVPGDFVFIEQLDFETFFAGVEIQILECCSEEHVDLGDVRQTEQSV